MEEESLGDWQTVKNSSTTENDDMDWDTLVTNPSDSMGEIDRYELKEQLGAGGFGAVFRATDTVSGLDVAIKVLPPILSAVPEELENVRANFAIVNKLHHPNIANVDHLHKVDKTNVDDKILRVFEGSYIVVMEYVKGFTLSSWKKQFNDNKVPLEKAIDICAKVADALDFAHSKKIIHRDIKPSNIMVTPDGDVKVLDFGLAAEIRSSMSRVSQEQGDTSGTRPYMAPEQWSGKKQGTATDQYALAVMLYELISGEVPFESVFNTGDSILMMNVVETKIPEPIEELSKKQNTALLSGLAKSADERFANCADLISSIDGKRMKRKSSLRSPNAKSKRLPIILTVLILLSIASYFGYQNYKEAQAIGPEQNKDWTIPDLNMKFAFVANGSFQMGSNEYDSEKPIHRVTISKPFWIGKYEVTQKDFRVFINSTSFQTQAEKQGYAWVYNGSTWTTENGKKWSNVFSGEDRPVTCVSWDDAIAFCKWLTDRERKAGRLLSGYKYSLPTEAEWEYCARGGNKSRGYKYSGSNNIDSVAWYSSNSGSKTHSVGTKQSNELGIYDMSGNVWEWCSDWYDSGYYAKSPSTDPKGISSASSRVIRGGCWRHGAKYCRSADRYRYVPSCTRDGLGFRVALVQE